MKSGRECGEAPNLKPSMRLLLARRERVGSRLRRSGSMFVAQQKRETVESSALWML
jgi:hypothetical protein